MHFSSCDIELHIILFENGCINNQHEHIHILYPLCVYTCFYIFHFDKCNGRKDKSLLK